MYLFILYLYKYSVIYIYIYRYTDILHQGYISSRMASKASSATVGTGEEDVICHFESKYDEYCILIWEVFSFFSTFSGKNAGLQ